MLSPLSLTLIRERIGEIQKLDYLLYTCGFSPGLRTGSVQWFFFCNSTWKTKTNYSFEIASYTK